jgi:GNAT superfamily N-acetyltransferase
MSLVVAPVAGRSDLEQFVRLPWHIYRADQAWVPPILDHQRILLDPQRHPFHGHAQVALFLARRDGTVLGRVAAIVNHRHVAVHSELVGFFGFFESVAEPAVAAALLDAAGAWLARRGIRAMRGPMSFSVNEECGLLVEGFETPPTFMLPHNPPYYEALIEGCGLRKVADLLVYRGHLRAVSPAHLDRVRRIAARVRAQPAVTLRQPDMARFDEEIGLIASVYNRAWSENWGSVPMTAAEIHHLARQLKPLAVPKLARLALVDGQPAAFGLLLPDYNEVLRHANGRLWPVGLPLLLASRVLGRITGLRMLLFGVVDAHRRRGLDALLMHDLHEAAIEQGYRRCDVGWVLEQNHLMNNAIRAWGGQLVKRYRIYERGLACPAATGAPDTDG